MKTQNKTIQTMTHSIVEDARELIAATVGMTDESVGELRRRLSAILDSGGEWVDNFENKVVKGTKETDRAVHRHPYRAIGVAAGIAAGFGAILGCWATRNCGGFGK